MGKIRLQDLAKRMNVAEQDLLFKFRSIGVRVEGEDAMIDTDIIKALLEGKKIAGPQREVILRDRAAPPAAPRRRPISSLRPPAGPMRPNRRRSIVHKQTIRTLTPTETKPKPPTPEEIAAKEIAAEEAAAAARTPAQPAEAPPATPAGTPKTEPASAPAAETVLAPAAGETSPAIEARAQPQPAPPQVDLRTRRERQEDRKKAGEVAAEEERERGTITISEGLQVRDLAEKMGVKAKDLLKMLFDRGLMATVNHLLEPELAVELAEQMGFEALIVSFEEEIQLEQEEELEASRAEADGPTRVERPPIVTIMGHVDHGKTSLLDAIRKSRLTEGEFGGITQHIAAYQVAHNGGRITFLDTPGHEAFTQLRARGAQVTDIVILVVAADDGVMPQTLEALDHARAADVPILVAINKIDRPNANVDRVKQQLADRDLVTEDWGGDVIAVPVSAIKGDGIDDLLEMINLTAEVAELRSSPELQGQGVVIEASKETGRGSVATVLVQDGTLCVGDVFVCGSTWGRVRSLMNDLGKRVTDAPPSTPVEVSGFNELPEAGDPFQATPQEARARSIAEFRSEEKRRMDLAPTTGGVSLESLFASLKEGEVKELPVILKADVQGSVEVLRETLHKLSTEKVKVRVIRSAVGAVTTHDVLLASAAGAIIYGFNVRPERSATELAAKEEVDVRLHTVIYELTDELIAAMTGLLEPTYREVSRGRAEVREIFKVPKVGMIAGCHVIAGVIARNSQIRLVRDSVVVHEGRIGSLRRFKDDTAEVRSGFDCGIGIDRFQDVKPGDLIEAFDHEAVAPTL
ncbi:MAG: translation initiation factor IF-2 [Holophagales bacterium]|nr:translation initiation factor IF-2 [Holophagales bacterium]MYH25812.1 translation initiation factor IF-2 [Holophagales bacterium]